MARPATLLLAVVVCFLGGRLPPAAARPALLKPEGSYSPQGEAAIQVVDVLLNQLLNQLATSYGHDTGPFSDEDDFPEAENSQEAEVKPLQPRPLVVSPARPPNPPGSGGGGFYAGSETNPETQPVNNGRIVFPSY